jgi:hypothetical protein
MNAECLVAWCEHGSAADVKAYKPLHCEYKPEHRATLPLCHSATRLT